MITLDAPETVHAGEPIAGTVRATGRVRVFVRRTTIWHGAARYGGDTPVSRDREGVVVTGDAPFVLPALRGPLTHAGERAELRWSVVAESLDDTTDRAAIPFTLVAPRTTTYEREAAGGYRDRPTETTTLEPDFGERHVEGPRREVVNNNDPFAMFGAWVIRTFTALTASGAGASNVTLDVTPSRVRAGGEIVAKLAFTTRDELVVESITIQLIAHEHWGLPGDQHFIDSRSQTVTERARLAPGPHAYEARIDVPAAAMPSFSTEGLGLEWFVRATIQVDGLADAVSDFIIGVAPF